DGATRESILDTFHAAHERAYGFASASEPVQIVNVAVKAIADLDRPELPMAPEGAPARPAGHRLVLFDGDGRVETPLYARSDLTRGQVIEGPGIIEQMDATVLVFPGDRARTDRWGNLVTDVKGT
ncbi:MAG: hydantoinase/oxoprolinase family protein, partial [Boseongicola sp.]|nr:hydantoinase/oxoprolinase family protein [Boseongicola sp.]